MFQNVFHIYTYYGNFRKINNHIKKSKEKKENEKNHLEYYYLETAVIKLLFFLDIRMRVCVCVCVVG